MTQPAKHVRKRYALILAGGSGKRMGSDVPKQFLHLRPDSPHCILSETMLRFAPLVDHGILVLAKSEVEQWKKICQQEGLDMSHFAIAYGGSTRFESVKSGLSLVPPDALVAIHDGVRPFVTAGMIERSFAAASEYGGSLPAVPVVDSLRHIKPNGASEVVNRAEFVFVQTPQTFRSEMIKKAYEQAYKPIFTDDASVYEAYWQRPMHLIAGSPDNIKITNASDLR